MTTRTRLSVLLLSTPLLIFIIVGGVFGNSSGGDDTFQHLRVFEDVVSLVLNNYVEEVKVDRAMEGAMRGLADGLDPDSAYLTPDEVKALDAAPAPGDVGIQLTRQYYLRIIATRDDSPAAKAGLQTGDYVRAIDGKPTRDMSVFEGMRALRGAPGSRVQLTVIRGNAADPHDIDLVREKTPGAVVSGHLMPPHVGYIRIATFGAGAADLVRSQADSLAKAGATHLIIDVRHTAEGPFDSGLETARLFVKSGTLAEIAGRDPSQTAPPAPRAADAPAPKVPRAAITQTIAAKPGDGSIMLPVTLLVTTGTSGPAELFAAALDENHRATLVGERTLGRAAIQKLVPLPNGRGLWLTYARYVGPNGEAIQGHGLTPDAEVDQPDLEWGETTLPSDPILDKAIQRINP
jgi:carboxyl-terminal processing protease